MPPARGSGVAHARGVAAIHDKDGWLGAASIFGRIHEREGLTMRVWQSLPAERVDELATLRLRSRIGDDFLRLGYLKAFMDGTLGSQTALMLDGSGVRITSREQLEDLIRRGAVAGWPVSVHAIGDLANREALDAFEATKDIWAPLGLRHRIEHAQCLDPADLPRVRGDRRRLLGPALARPVRPRSRRALLGRPARRHICLQLALGIRARSSRTAPTHPSRSSTRCAGMRAGVLRTIDDRPAWRPARGATVEQALIASTVTPAWLAGDERRRGRLLPGFLADLVVLSR